MHRPLWTRSLAALVAAWFVLVTGAPDVFHACPVHGGHAMRMAAGPMPGHRAAGADASATTGDAAPAGRQSPATPAPDHGRAHCNCPADCGAGAHSALLSAAPELLAAVSERRASAPLAPRASRRPEAPPHTLPFPIGPPDSARLA